MQFPPAFVQRALDAIDRTQQRFKPSAFAIGVLKRYGDDRGGMYAALITFYALLSIFPLLLLFVTVASMILGAHSTAEQNLVNSALGRFPVIGDKLAQNISALSRGSWLTFVVFFLFSLWGSLGITSALQMASHRAWRRPRKDEPNIWIRTWRGLLLLGVIAAAAVLTPVAAGILSSNVFHNIPLILTIFFNAVIFLINAGAYFLAFRILAPHHAGWKELIAGTLVGAFGWTMLQLGGSLLVAHELRHVQAIYGLFGLIIGLIFWLNLGAQLFLYSSEINVVVAQGGWPRSLFDPSDEVKAELGEVAN